MNTHAQSMSAANVNREPTERAPIAVQPNIQSLSQPTKGVQIIPISSSSLSTLQYLSRAPQHSSAIGLDTMTAQSETSVQEDSYVNVNGDANNISLIKLMAILNNPALTITAVGSKEKSNNLIDDSSRNNNIFETFGRRATTVSKPKPTTKLPTHGGSIPSSSRNSTTKQKFPQSATNLQNIHESQQSEPIGISHQVSVNNPNLEVEAVEHTAQMQDDFRRKWLANSQNHQDLQANDEVQSQYPDDSLCETDQKATESSDPTMLSTSVRNLLMQQISQNTSKQQNKSAQLLRHIANQEQDNDEARVQDQVPVAESICVLGPQRVVKQISDDAKTVEKELSVLTSGLMKKKPHGPTKTSRHRLYVPGMDNGNLRHSRTNESRYYLSDIEIISSQEMEVHLSERHAMLDLMMNIDNKKKRRNDSTEPDEIFINRSKRVMSKIDFMLERKKRRRFERISGREAPKSNSLEDQCAESEEEWSSDEAMDLDSACIIKTQLPLEEIETQEKKNHFMSVGLVSRDTRHEIEVEQCERRFNLITPLAPEKLELPVDDINRFVETIQKTNGEDVELRVESNIKRNDLPLVEGLNRNTSRLKMSYMNLLGLEKRSKRTTLYKVKQLESSNVVKQADLSRTLREVIPDEPLPRLETQKQLSTNISLPATKSTPQPVQRLAAPSNCRNILKLPSKNDYMKCLGLMTS